MAYRNPFETDDDGFEEIHSAEVARIQQEKKLYQGRMVNSAQRSRRIIEETKYVAEKTEEELDRQEESLFRTETNLDKIHSDINIANRHLTSLKSIWGTVGNYFRKSPQPSQAKVTKPASSKEESRPVENEREKSAPMYNQSVDDDQLLSTSKEYNAVMDSHLDGVMGGLSELKAHALLMGDTLDRHNVILDRVTYKATEADKKIEDSDKKIKKILR